MNDVFEALQKAAPLNDHAAACYWQDHCERLTALAPPIRGTLTKKQAAAFKVIDDYIREHGEAPTLQEIADAIGVKGAGTAKIFVDALVERGYVRRLPGRQRGLTVL